MAKLEGAKPCPFCGNNVINIEVIDGAPKAWCTNCDAEGPSKHFGPDGTAAGAWNDTRAGEMDHADDYNDLRARLAEAEAALAESQAEVDRARAEGEAAGIARAVAVVEARAADREAQIGAARAAGGAVEAVALKAAELRAAAEAIRRGLGVQR